jgi:hypothetical protein
VGSTKGFVSSLLDTTPKVSRLYLATHGLRLSLVCGLNWNEETTHPPVLPILLQPVPNRNVCRVVSHARHDIAKAASRATRQARSPKPTGVRHVAKNFRIVYVSFSQNPNVTTVTPDRFAKMRFAIVIPKLVHTPIENRKMGPSDELYLWDCCRSRIQQNR